MVNNYRPALITTTVCGVSNMAMVMVLVLVLVAVINLADNSNGFSRNDRIKGWLEVPNNCQQFITTCLAIIA